MAKHAKRHEQCIHEINTSLIICTQQQRRNLGAMIDTENFLKMMAALCRYLNTATPYPQAAARRFTGSPSAPN